MLDDDDIKKIRSLFDGAVYVTSDFFSLLKDRYENLVELDKKSDSVSWGNEIMSFFRPKIESLFSHELPETKIPQSAGEMIDFLELNFDGNKETLKQEFHKSKCYLWLLSVLEMNDGCMYFGQLSAELHNALVSDPKPYRRDIKQLLSNLLDWIQELNMKEVIVDRPNHSQRIRLVRQF